MKRLDKMDEKYLFLNKIFVNYDTTYDFSNELSNVKELLLSMSSDDIFTFLYENKKSLTNCDPSNIPQFSNAGLLSKVINIVANSDELHTFEDVGYFLTNANSRRIAQRKYGENHYKLAAQLGLVTSQTRQFGLTSLGEIYYAERDELKRKRIVSILVWRIPIIQTAMIIAKEGECDLHKLLCKYLSESTAIRRRSNIYTLINWIYESSEIELQHIINRIVWKK